MNSMKTKRQKAENLEILSRVFLNICQGIAKLSPLILAAAGLVATYFFK